MIFTNAFNFETPNANPIPTDYVLAYDLDGDFLDKSVNGLHATPNRDGADLSFGDGLVLNGGSFVTHKVSLSGKMSMSFWIKTTQNVIGAVFELSANLNNSNAFACFINDISIGKIEILDHGEGYNMYEAPLEMNGQWQHVIMTIDRDLGVKQNSIFMNGGLDVSTPIAAYQNDLSGSWLEENIFFGQRNGDSFPLIGSLKKIRLYGRGLTPEERTALSNEI